jgi:alpha-L-fucosidase
VLIATILMAIFSCQNPSRSKNEKTDPKFEETWESLATIDREPEWFKDAKFGIYFHWGLYSVPAYDNEWYPRWMYVPGREDWGGTVYEHHKKTYGHVNESNYHDFIPMFTAEHFDAAEWANLFHKSGARFAGLVAQHHDGFAMWGSKVNPWNVKGMGPEKDILGELFAELKKRDMQTIATFHHARFFSAMLLIQLPGLKIHPIRVGTAIIRIILIILHQQPTQNSGCFTEIFPKMNFWNIG